MSLDDLNVFSKHGNVGVISIVTGIIIYRLFYYLELIQIKSWNIATQTIYLIIRIIILETAQK